MLTRRQILVLGGAVVLTRCSARSSEQHAAGPKLASVTLAISGMT